MEAAPIDEERVRYTFSQTKPVSFRPQQHGQHRSLYRITCVPVAAATRNILLTEWQAQHFGVSCLICRCCLELPSIEWLHGEN